MTMTGLNTSIQLISAAHKSLLERVGEPKAQSLYTLPNSLEIPPDPRTNVSRTAGAQGGGAARSFLGPESRGEGGYGVFGRSATSQPAHSRALLNRHVFAPLGPGLA